MNIQYASAFVRAYKKLTPSQKEQVDGAIALFAIDPFHPKLRNHKLKGSKETIRSIAAAYDLRILYLENDGHSLVLMLAVGTHDEVY